MSQSVSTAALGPVAPQYVQPIYSDYYNIVSDDGRPVAALLVLLDRQRAPVRAEIHLYEDVPEDVLEWGYRQGRSILEARYYSDEAVPLKVFQSYQGGETMHVQATGINQPVAEEQPWFQRWQFAAVAGILVLLIAFIWALSALLRGPSTATTATLPAQSQSPTASENTGDDTTAANSDPAAAGQNGALPASRQADPSLTIGARIRVRPGLRLSLVSEAGADSTVVGYMQDQQEAIIIDGPVLTQGERDTIVWWRVRLDDGTEAWAPANTSDAPVLEPVP